MRRTIASVTCSLLILAVLTAQAKPDDMPFVAVSKDKKGFVFDPSGRPFVPWGFNYDHDTEGRLIEDYWEDEWPAVEAHFAQMRKLGANVVRVHLQLSRFMDGPDKPNARALDRLGKLLGWPRGSGSTSTSPAWAVTTRRTCPPGTTSSPRRSAGTCRPASGGRWRAAAPHAPPSSATT